MMLSTVSAVKRQRSRKLTTMVTSGAFAVPLAAAIFRGFLNRHHPGTAARRL
jgi:hypothetical protein